MKKLVMYIGDEHNMWSPKKGTVGELVESGTFKYGVKKVRWPRGSIKSDLEEVFCWRGDLLDINCSNIKQIVKELIKCFL